MDTARRPLAALGAVCLAALACVVLLLAGPAGVAEAAGTGGTLAADAQGAAALAQAQGYRTGIAVLDLSTGAVTTAGDATGYIASESVVKTMIAAELLLTGQMTGSTETTAYRMITLSDDDAADALYGLAGGDDVLPDVAAHYGITDLGRAPSSAGWWGNTEISATGLVQFYAAVAKDPVVGPWLEDAMAHTQQTAADGTDQFFGIPEATTGAAIKQGWGDDGDDSPDAVFDSTGFVGDWSAGGGDAVAILTDGPSSTYGSAISAVVTAEAKALMPTGTVDDPAAHDPALSGVAVSATGGTVTVTGTATDPDTQVGVPVVVSEDGHTVATGSTGDGTTFSVSFAADAGSHTYEVTASDVGEGAADATVTTPAVLVTGSVTAAGTAPAASVTPVGDAVRSPVVLGATAAGGLLAAVALAWWLVRRRGVSAAR